MATARRPSTPAKGKSAAKPRHARVVKETVWSRHQRDIWIVLMILAGLLLLLAEVNALGPVGHALSTGLELACGLGRIAVPILLIGLGVILVMGRVELDRARFTWSIVLALISGRRRRTWDARGAGWASPLGGLWRTSLAWGAPWRRCWPS
jgi:hypothetical protein